jgi:glycosyltransferase involved in cell wall biosynthesis
LANLVAKDLGNLVQKSNRRSECRIVYAAGPGNVIQAHKHWTAGEADPSQVSITFSSQFEDFCQDIGAKAYIVSYNDKKQIFHDGPFILEHRPKLMRDAVGIRYHFREMLYAFSLLATAVRFRANWALLDSGTTHYFAMSLFRLAGIRVVVILHNTLWPNGYPPNSRSQKLISLFDSIFFRWVADAIIGVSPVCLRQVEQLTGVRHKFMYQIRAQYCPEVFATIPPPPPLDRGYFRILFLGRIDNAKGAFDILEIAQKIESRAPRRVRWDICGDGPLYEQLRIKHGKMGLGPVVTLHGWLTPEMQHDLRALSHAVIVPTRSNFAEGFAMTAAEAILSGRPVITNAVVPALEVLRPACVEARTDEIDSYVEQILKLMNDPEWYGSLCEACPALQKQFYNGILGTRTVLNYLFTQI